MQNGSAAAISRVICTNDAFRLRFRTQGNGAVQYLYEGEPEIELLDLSGELTPELAYERLCADMFQEPFILEGGRMYRFLVCRLRKNKTVYFVKLHHLIRRWLVYEVIDGTDYFCIRDA